MSPTLAREPGPHAMTYYAMQHFGHRQIVFGMILDRHCKQGRKQAGTTLQIDVRSASISSPTMLLSSRRIPEVESNSASAGGQVTCAPNRHT